MSYRDPGRTCLTIVGIVLLGACALGQWVEDSIDVGGRAVGSLIYNSRADVVYGVSESGDLFFAIDCATNQVIESWSIPCPLKLAYDSIDNKVYCTTIGGGYDAVYVISGETHRAIGRIPLYSARLLVWDPDRNRVYVSCSDDNEIAVIDCATDSVIATVPVGLQPLGIHLNRRHGKLYVQNHGNWQNETVSIVDLDALVETSRIQLNDVPTHGCYSYSADKYYFGTLGRTYVVSIDGVGDTVVAEHRFEGDQSTITTLLSVEEHALVLAGVVSYSGDTVFAFDTRADTVLSRLRVPFAGGVEDLFWSELTHQVYCTSGYWDMGVLSERGDTIRKVLRAGRFGCVQVLSPRSQRLYVGHTNDDHVYVVRDAVGGVAESGPEDDWKPEALVARPSPFRERVVISAPAGVAQASGLDVFSPTGALVRRIESGENVGGVKRYVWDGRDTRGRQSPPGVYVVVATGSPVASVRIVKLR